MTGAVKIDRIDGSTLDVGVEDDAPLVVIAKTNDVPNELFRFDAGERCVKIVGVADMNRIDPRHT